MRQLQREEQKAEKRIEETKERANEVLSLRERNVQKAREKELRLRELQVEVAKQRKSNVKRKEVTRRNKELRETQIMESRDQMVRPRGDAHRGASGPMCGLPCHEPRRAAPPPQAQEVRIERAVLEDELQREKILARKRAVEQKEQIRRAKEEATQKLEQRKLAELINAHEVRAWPVPPRQSRAHGCLAMTWAIHARAPLQCAQPKPVTLRRCWALFCRR